MLALMISKAAENAERREVRARSIGLYILLSISLVSSGLPQALFSDAASLLPILHGEAHFLPTGVLIEVVSISRYLLFTSYLVISLPGSFDLSSFFYWYPKFSSLNTWPELRKRRPQIRGCRFIFLHTTFLFVTRYTAMVDRKGVQKRSRIAGTVFSVRCMVQLLTILNA